MALCLKCLIGSAGEGGGLLPPDMDRFRVGLVFDPDSEEAQGTREAVFEGDILAGDPLAGGVSAKGVLRGNFGLSAEESVEATAFVETYTRDGSIALVTLNVFEGDEPGGRVTFSATFTPRATDAPVEDTSFDAVVFMGRTAAATAS